MTKIPREPPHPRSQPALHVGNMRRRRRDVPYDLTGTEKARTKSQRTEPDCPKPVGTRPNDSSSCEKSSLATIASHALARQPIRPRMNGGIPVNSSYTDLDLERDAQAQPDIDICDESGHKYQNSHASGETDTDTKRDVEEIGVEEERTTSERYQQSWTGP
ncbi:hypothetical protein C7212DRAFT_345236 [Tuber magnatum]|uniref:Uncharacterized protein n=1 Tax=Tuber magnatum TaxID=42249 RepID=A0A317SP64_9PEZI|nr:hypothetical protein C7212DRAFT_345236 [Tuber magnatum]